MANKKVLILTTQEGHESIAHGVNDILQKHKIDSEVFLYNEPALNQYKFFYKHLPKAYRFIYQLSFSTIINFLFLIYIKITHDKIVKEQVKKHQPDIIINTMFSFNPSLEFYYKKIKIINILPNPRTCYRQDISHKSDFNLIFDETMKKICHKVNTKAKLRLCGWFVRKQFSKKINKNQLRKKLGLENKLTFLITSGSEGIENITTFTKNICSSKLQIQLIIACGHNNNLLKKIQSIVTNNPQNKIIALPFVKNLEDYMIASDLVIGKAGPNTIFEATATLTPFFAITHIHGQEDGNLDVIREYNLGYVEENQKKAEVLLKKIISNPKQLEDFMPDIKQIAKYNNSAEETLLKIIKD